MSSIHIANQIADSRPPPNDLLLRIAINCAMLLQLDRARAGDLKSAQAFDYVRLLSVVERAFRRRRFVRSCLRENKEEEFLRLLQRAASPAYTAPADMAMIASVGRALFAKRTLVERVMDGERDPWDIL